MFLFLTSAFDGGERLASSSGSHAYRETLILFIHLKGRLYGCKEGVDILETGRISIPSPESHQETSVVYSTT